MSCQMNARTGRTFLYYDLGSCLLKVANPSVFGSLKLFLALGRVGGMGEFPVFFCWLS